MLKKDTKCYSKCYTQFLLSLDSQENEYLINGGKKKESWTWKTGEVGQELENIKLVYFLMHRANKMCRKMEKLNYKGL